MYKLSILIPSVEPRYKQLNRLLHYLSKQVDRNCLSNVEIIVYKDNFETSTYKKRNILLGAASGEYLVFIDDDDSVPNYYLPTILNNLHKPVDYVGYRVLVALDGYWSKETIHSLRFNEWSEDEDFYYRDVTHINPIRSSIAKSVSFPEREYAEDSAWANLLRDKVKREVFIDRIMYFYNSHSRTTLMNGDPTNNISNQDIDWKIKPINDSIIRYIGGV